MWSRRNLRPGSAVRVGELKGSGSFQHSSICPGTLQNHEPPFQRPAVRQDPRRGIFLPRVQEERSAWIYSGWGGQQVRQMRTCRPGGRPRPRKEALEERQGRSHVDGGKVAKNLNPHNLLIVYFFKMIVNQFSRFAISIPDFSQTTSIFLAGRPSGHH